MRSRVVLPQPLGPEQRQQLALLHVDVHAVHGGDLPERLDDAADPEVAHGSPAWVIDVSASLPER